MKKILILLIVSLLFPHFVLADSNFDIAYDLFYQFNENEIAQVTQTTTITNRKTNLFPTEYEIIVRGKLIDKVSGFDNLGILEVTAENAGNKENENKIKVKFREKSTGIGNKLAFSLNYSLTDLTNSIGLVKEVLIPKVSGEGVTAYSVNVSVPKTYGLVSYVKPENSYSTTDNRYIFNFKDPAIQKGGVIGFGEYAHYLFNLSYHLTNSTVFKKTFEIALLPDTPFQKIIYQRIEPPAKSLSFDKDGNLLAVYDLLPKESLTIIATGSALLSNNKRTDYYETEPDNFYLQPQKYWEVEDPLIKSQAAKLKNINEVYDYVSQNLKYNYSRINSDKKRLGAKEGLMQPSNAICMEFTDTFIALSRALEIPAREVNGYAYTNDQYLKPLSLVADVLHSWPEYWDYEKKAWVAVDTTWANTTGGLDYFHSFDLNHLVFVKRGLSSTIPLAAGSYKTDQSGKDVLVNLSNQLPEIPAEKIDYQIKVSEKIKKGEKLPVKITANNKTGVTSFHIPVIIVSAGFKLPDKNIYFDLPPFSEKEINLELETENNIENAKIPLEISVGQTLSKSLVEVRPAYNFQILGAVVIIIFLVLISKKYVF